MTKKALRLLLCLSTVLVMLTASAAASYQIYVECPQSSTLTLDVNANDTILAVKESLADRIGVQVQQMILSFLTQVLNNENSLSDYDVQKSATLTLSYTNGLVVSGGTLGTDYTYENGLLTITKGGNYVLSMADGITTTSDAIIVDTAPASDGHDKGPSLTGDPVTLTLDDVNIAATYTEDGDGGAQTAYAIDASTPLNIVLADDSHSFITAKSFEGSNSYSRGINSEDELTISGGGALTVTGGEAMQSFGIYCNGDSLSISDEAEVSVSTAASKIPGGAEGVSVNGVLNVTDASLTVVTGALTVKSSESSVFARCIYAVDALSFENAVVTCTTGAVTNSIGEGSCAGIDFGYEDSMIIDSTLSVTLGEVSAQSVTSGVPICGIAGSAPLILVGSTVSITNSTGEEASAVQAYPITAEGATITGADYYTGMYIGAPSTGSFTSGTTKKLMFSAGSTFVEITAPDIVVNIAAIEGVAAPTAGAAPASAITETDQYTGAVTWSPAVSGSFDYGTSYTATITLTAKNGYTLNGVTEDFFTVENAESAASGADTGVITAVFPATAAASPPPAPSYSDSYTPSTPASSGGRYTPPALTVPVSSDFGSADVSASVSDETASVTITDRQLEKIIHSAKVTGTVTVDVSGLENVNTASIPANVVSATVESETATGLSVTLPTGSVMLDAAAVNAVNTGGDVVISVEEVIPDDLTAEQKDALGDKLDSAVVVDVNVLVGGVKQRSFNGGSITVCMPYTAKDGEDTSRLVVWYIADDGGIEPMDGYYDEENECFVFTTTHLSQYVLVSAALTNPFADVAEGAYYYDAVLWSADKEIARGVTGSAFQPDAVCTRAQAVTFLWRAMGSPEPVGSVCRFDDVDTDAYCYKAVLWALENGVTVGTGAATFSPDAACTRSQVVAFLYRAAGSPAAGTAEPFGDVQPDAYYADAVCWAVEKEITNGTSANSFGPDDDCTRGQIVTFIYRSN